MQHCNVRCGHEVVFGPHGFGWGDYEADASWLAAPHVRTQPDLFVVHLVRQPLLVLRSSASFFSETMGAYHDAIRRAVPQVFEVDDPIERFSRYWIHWNALVDDRADMQVRIEDTDGPIAADVISSILRRSGREIDHATIQRALGSVPTNFNRHSNEDPWARACTADDLSNVASFAKLKFAAQRYGYTVGKAEVTISEIRCPFCHELARPEFDAQVRGRYLAMYASCTICGSLHVVDPHWHEEAHRDITLGERVDGGAAWRNTTLLRLMESIAPLTPAGPWLDYGCGNGTLVAELSSRGYDIVGYDPYYGIDLEQGVRFRVVSCFEVLEHQKDPVAFMREISARLADDGVLLMSTWLWEPRHGRNWSYLAKEAGQHCAFPSRQGLRALCRSTGLVWRMSGVSRENEGLQVHVVARKETDSPHMLSSALSKAGFEPIID